MISQLTRTRFGAALLDAALAVRALMFIGRRHVCPCCGWHLRAFTHGGLSLRTRHQGFCPRCNAKARHRRDWLYLQQTNLFTERHRLLHVSPRYALARRFRRMANLDYVALDVEPRSLVTVQADATAMPLGDGSFDALICIHVLEHIDDDRAAMDEFFRVLKPGGWALITVPLMLDRPTYEDPAITAPEDRKVAFGETSHVRHYGIDVVQRLEARGFEVELELGSDIDPEVMIKYGLLSDENILFCSKPPLES